MTLFAATTGADTDFTAKLVDVEPCGAARALVDGIMRGRYRKGTDTAVPITPGAVEEYTIDLVATSNVFKAGHRVRLEISSSNFPRFDRNFNTGDDPVGGHRVRAGGSNHHARRAVSVAAAAARSFRPRSSGPGIPDDQWRDTVAWRWRWWSPWRC